MVVGHLYIFFGEMSISLIFLFFNWVVWFLLLWFSCMSYLYVLECNLLSVTSFGNIFCHSVDCLFILFMVSFAVQKLVSVIRSCLFIFAQNKCIIVGNSLLCSTAEENREKVTSVSLFQIWNSLCGASVLGLQSRYLLRIHEYSEILYVCSFVFFFYLYSPSPKMRIPSFHQILKGHIDSEKLSKGHELIGFCLKSRGRGKAIFKKCLKTVSVVSN